MTRAFREGRHTLLVALCGVAGAIVVSCSPTPAHTAQPKDEWSDACIATEPLIRAAGAMFHRGWVYPFAKAFVASERAYSPTARALLLGYLKARYDYPTATYGQFVDAALFTCSKLTHLEPRDFPYHGAEFWLEERKI